MKFLADFLPIILFFVFYKIWGIYVATAAAIATSMLQLLLTFIKQKKLDKMQLFTLLIITTLGGATLLLHDEMFIKWKPTAVNWLFAAVFLGNHFFAKTPLVKTLMGGSIELPAQVWKKLNLSWSGFFSLMGAINIYVIYHYSTDAWVNYKLFGNLGLTILFVIIQAFCLYRYAQEQ